MVKFEQEFLLENKLNVWKCSITSVIRPTHLPKLFVNKVVSNPNERLLASCVWLALVKPRKILGLLGFVFLTACTQQQIEFQAISHNRAISSSADEILFTNILRASRNLAVDYTAIADYQAKDSISGSISPKLPFGSDAPNVFGIDPKLDISPGITSIKVTNFGHQEKAYKDLHKPSDIEDIRRRASAGWHSRLVWTIFWSRLFLRGKFGQEVVRRADKKCFDGNDKIYKGSCREIHEADELCPIGTPKTIAFNRGDEPCDFAMFQALISRLRLVGISARPFAVSGKQIAFPEDDGPESLEKLFEAQKVIEQQKGNPDVIATGNRSTDGIIRFIGQLVQSQLRTRESNTPSIYLHADAPKKSAVFKVNIGKSANYTSGISTNFRGKWYNVPDTDLDDPLSHKSMEVFSYLRERLDQAYSTSDQPASNTVILQQ